jgi:hypothetical protein
MRRHLTRIVPAFALVVAAALAGAPLSVATNTDTRTVTATVMTSTSVTTPSCPTPIMLSVARGGTSITATDCTVSFESNSATGVDLRMTDTSDVTALTDGAGHSIPDLPTNLAPIASDGFGACLRAVGNGATGRWSPNGTCTSSMPQWFGLTQLTPKSVAYLSGPGTGTASFRFGARVSATQAPTSYSGQVTFEVVANP